MANNRMRLTCTVCGLWVTLAKFHAAGAWGARHTEAELDEFFDKHIDCLPREKLALGDIFRFEYEHYTDVSETGQKSV